MVAKTGTHLVSVGVDAPGVGSMSDPIPAATLRPMQRPVGGDDQCDGR
jgi:hypothetical protein